MIEKTCLGCKNTIKVENGVEYCKYCGAPVVNTCSNYNCSKPLDDDAAFCPFCGEKSTFNNAGLVLASGNFFNPKPKLPF